MLSCVHRAIRFNAIATRCIHRIAWKSYSANFAVTEF
jgi:hypothetical protein